MKSGGAYLPIYREMATDTYIEYRYLYRKYLPMQSIGIYLEYRYLFRVQVPIQSIGTYVEYRYLCRLQVTMQSIGTYVECMYLYKINLTIQSIGTYIGYAYLYREMDTHEDLEFEFPSTGYQLKQSKYDMLHFKYVQILNLKST